MYNEDVEELARLVSIGTKVTFLYETIFAWDDPVTGEPLVLIPTSTGSASTGSMP